MTFSRKSPRRASERCAHSPLRSSYRRASCKFNLGKTPGDSYTTLVVVWRGLDEPLSGIGRRSVPIDPPKSTGHGLFRAFVQGRRAELVRRACERGRVLQVSFQRRLSLPERLRVSAQSAWDSIWPALPPWLKNPEAVPILESAPCVARAGDPFIKQDWEGKQWN